LSSPIGQEIAIILKEFYDPIPSSSGHAIGTTPAIGPVIEKSNHVFALSHISIIVYTLDTLGQNHQ
jgi:hypothetical protein